MPSHEVVGGSGAMFDRIAARYDRLNRILSFGLDHRWRKTAVGALDLTPNAHVLDIATGTGDVAIEVARTHPCTQITGVDTSANMLSIGRQKLTTLQIDDRVRLEFGDAQALHYADNSFDAAIMAFGIRNVPDRALALREIARVVRPGGRLAVLELSEPKSGVLGVMARFHVHVLVPRIGAWLSQAGEYRYLQQSIAAFPSADDFLLLMKNNGWTDVSAQSLTFGAVHLFIGTVADIGAEVPI